MQNRKIVTPRITIVVPIRGAVSPQNTLTLKKNNLIAIKSMRCFIDRFCSNNCSFLLLWLVFLHLIYWFMFFRTGSISSRMPERPVIWLAQLKLVATP